MIYLFNVVVLNLLFWNYYCFNKGSINENYVLHGIDLILEDGEYVIVIGGNGAGKSTTLTSIQPHLTQKPPQRFLNLPIR